MLTQEMALMDIQRKHWGPLALYVLLLDPTLLEVGKTDLSYARSDLIAKSPALPIWARPNYFFPTLVYIWIILE